MMTAATSGERSGSAAGTDVDSAGSSRRRDPESPTVSRTLREFARHSSIHGVGSVARARSAPCRLFWSALFCAAALLFTGQFGVLIRRFFSNPSKVRSTHLTTLTWVAFHSPPQHQPGYRSTHLTTPTWVSFHSPPQHQPGVNMAPK